MYVDIYIYDVQVGLSEMVVMVEVHRNTHVLCFLHQIKLAANCFELFSSCIDCVASSLSLEIKQTHAETKIACF